MTIEELLTETMAIAVASPPHAPDLASQAIADASRIRRRRAAVAAAATATAVLLTAITLTQVARRPDADRPAVPVSGTSLPGTSLPASPLPGSSSPTSAPTSATGSPTVPADGYGARLEEALRGLPTGAAPAFDVIVGTTLHRAGDGQLTLPALPGMVVASAHPAARSWLITYVTDNSSNQHDELQYRVVLLRSDGTSNDLGTGVQRSSGQFAASAAVTADGTRAAVQTSDGTKAGVRVVELPSGRELARTALPADSPFGAVAWSGGVVVLSARSGDVGPTAADVWDPARGPFEPDPAPPAFRFLGRHGSGGELLALTDGTGTDQCLVVVDPPAGFAVRARRCGLPTSVTASPDGQRLFQMPSSQGGWLTLDTATVLAGGTSWVPLGVPAGLGQRQVWSESSARVLVAVSVQPEPGTQIPPQYWLRLLRCPVDGGRCERAPTPEAPGERALLVYPY